MTDLISRQAAIDALGEKPLDWTEDEYELGLQNQWKYDVDAIKALPPITPKQKTGHWIMPRNDDGMSDPIEYQVRCSECGFDLDPQTWYEELHRYDGDKFCPHCGSKNG